MTIGMKENITNKAAENISNQSAKLFGRIIEIQESMHAHLEHILKHQVNIENELRVRNGRQRKHYEYEKQ